MASLARAFDLRPVRRSDAATRPKLRAAAASKGKGSKSAAGEQTVSHPRELMRIVTGMETQPGLENMAWDDVVDRLLSPGWARLGRAVAASTLEALEQAAPSRWAPLPDSEGDAGVRQAGISVHCAVDEATDVVRSLADGIKAGIDGASSADTGDGSIPPLPAFNHAQWCRAERGRQFITPHSDPSTAGGVIAVLTLRGRATFRIWDLDGPLVDAADHPELTSSWDSEDGDLVLMRGGGWPLPTSRCPIHEAESPLEGDRVTLTLRHNKGGFGSDYFA